MKRNRMKQARKMWWYFADDAEVADFDKFPKWCLRLFQSCGIIGDFK